MVQHGSLLPQQLRPRPGRQRWPPAPPSSPLQRTAVLLFLAAGLLCVWQLHSSHVLTARQHGGLAGGEALEAAAPPPPPPEPRERPPRLFFGGGGGEGRVKRCDVCFLFRSSSPPAASPQYSTANMTNKRTNASFSITTTNTNNHQLNRQRSRSSAASSSPTPPPPPSSTPSAAPPPPTTPAPAPGRASSLSSSSAGAATRCSPATPTAPARTWWRPHLPRT